MKYKLKGIFTNWRVIFLIIFLIFSVFAIKPQILGNEGVAIKNIAQNSSAEFAGLESPSSNLPPLSKERILSINGETVKSPDNYYEIVSALKEDRTVIVKTNKGKYDLLTKTNEAGVVDLGMTVFEIPSSNLKKGLDLEGGTRVLLKPEGEVSEEDLETTLDNLKERLNAYGLSDVVIRTVSDLEGDDYILIEIAGGNEGDVEQLKEQGKFEAKIGNSTVFFGGKKDITYVCKSTDCSGIDPRVGCYEVTEGYACGFYFGITLTEEAAERQAKATDLLTVLTGESGGTYLSDDIVLYLDDNEVDRLRIGADLKGKATTNIQISGSGSGPTEIDALNNALDNMKRLQTIIITGSLPVKLNIVKMDNISPSLGKEFLNNIIFVGLLAILAVVTVVLIRYRKIKVVIPMVLTMVSEIVLILGFAALVGWNLDLAAIAGIIIVAGTGVDHLIVITDETLKGEVISDWKKRIKNAMFIVVGAYLTTCAGMLPLWFAGAGLLKGFAFTTIIGISFGVLIARPAYATMIEHLLKD
ncbi:hypothetical protein HOE37_00380 [Candidatus Woesearchaeota archaeon]|jgi:preprotein translocase subunit SecD|nr:hypothetical protein [Candidatus Woesearchaeota archaeon]MBT4110292.1 hypothetical protein [Candidatus Woesearchaeota archaeon]MBT4336184.1 hypothetical protein [Candidatus Woesearchaeota archaeon]MBT4468837.1 hypothetical protein [Candidatus Woesearchaeota archaeon]MBT6744844.1 hypothetical protein [Candidatus Woesearchaeota archaeon]